MNKNIIDDISIRLEYLIINNIFLIYKSVKELTKSR